jgi:hypothetical protein
MGWEDMDMEKFYHDQKKKERDCEWRRHSSGWPVLLLKSLTVVQDLKLEYLFYG